MIPSTMIARLLLTGAAALLLLLSAVPARSQGTGPPGDLAVAKTDSGALVDPSGMPAPLDSVRFDQRLGNALPLDARFVDEKGVERALGDYFGERPVVLAFVYYECPMLCTLILNGLAKSLAVLTLDPGSDFDVVAVSIDHEETPALAQAAGARTLERYGKPETAAGWHFLTGSEEAVARVAEAAGFRYVYDPDTDEYAHASGIVIVSPAGTINQYHYGIEYPPRDVRLALVDASEGRAGSLVDQLLLYCYRYDAKLGKYTAATMRIVRLGGVVFVLLLSAFLWIMWRRERAVAESERSTVGAAHP